MGRLITCPPEPVEITCAALRTLGNAGDVVPGQAYLVTDYNRGTVGPATILTHGVTANTVSWDVAVQTQFDDSAWMARWDPDTCRIVDMFDNLGNKIRSDNGDEIDVFPWGNTSVLGNDFTDTDFNYGGGIVRDNVGHPTARLDTNGTANVQQNELNSLADVRVLDAAVMTRTEVSSRGRVRLNGTAQLLESTVTGYSYVDFDALRVRYSRFETSSLFYGDGATGFVDYLNSDRGYVDVRNNGNVDLDDVRVAQYGRVLGNGAARIRLLRVSADNYGYFQVTGAAELIAQYTNVSELSYIRNLTAGVLTVDRTDVSASARVDDRSNGTNRVLYTKIHSSGAATFLDTATGNLIDYGEIANSGSVQFRTGSANGRVHRTEVKSGQVDIQASNNVQVYYCEVTTIGYLRIRGGSNGFICYYSTFDGYGRMLVEQGSAGRVLGVEISSTGYVRLRGHASDLRYSSFNSYFYYYLTGNTAPKQGLHGSGRQTYTEPNPTATVTGPGVRNW